MTNPPGAMPPLPGPLNAEVLADLMTLHGRATKGVWAQGTSSHHTVAKRDGQEDYHIANFHHADDASFADVAHKYMPLLVARVTELERQNEAQKDEWLSWEAKRTALEKDAARYRLVRRGQHWSVIDGIGNTLRAEELDKQVDAAIAAKD